MSAQWIIKGLDPEGASVVTAQPCTHKHTNPHTCPLQGQQVRIATDVHTHTHTDIPPHVPHRSTNVKAEYLLTPPDN